MTNRTKRIIGRFMMWIPITAIGITMLVGFGLQVDLILFCCLSVLLCIMFGKILSETEDEET